eukprot:scaffold187681_cov29-Tisochrysis_lutea.AAC.1
MGAAVSTIAVINFQIPTSWSVAESSAPDAPPEAAATNLGSRWKPAALAPPEGMCEGLVLPLRSESSSASTAPRCGVGRGLRDCGRHRGRARWCSWDGTQLLEQTRLGRLPRGAEFGPVRALVLVVDVLAGAPHCVVQNPEVLSLEQLIDIALPLVSTFSTRSRRSSKRAVWPLEPKIESCRVEPVGVNAMHSQEVVRLCGRCGRPRGRVDEGMGLLLDLRE